MYNPYDLVSMTVNGKEMHGRPVAFDSEVVDQNAMTNAFGNVVKPIKLSTCCPDCGQGVEYDVYLAEPPFSVVSVICYNCHPEPEAQIDPFMNPIDDGRIGEHEIDPLLHDPNQQVVSENYSATPSDEGLSVADRFDFDELKEQGKEEDKEAPKKTPKKKTAKAKVKPKKAEKKPRKRPSRAKKKPLVNKNATEPAEGVGGEEPDLDDLDLGDLEDLVEQE